jgi:hypothetical protein
MSASFHCHPHCGERAKAPEDRNWGVINRECNFSAFNGYRYSPSDYSKLVCLTCGAVGHTKAKHVSKIRDVKLVAGEWKIVPSSSGSA